MQTDEKSGNVAGTAVTTGGSARLNLSEVDSSNEPTEQEAEYVYLLMQRVALEMQRNPQVCRNMVHWISKNEHLVNRSEHQFANMIDTFSSCSEHSGQAWVRHLSDVWASPDMVELNRPSSGWAGMVEDSINMRGYFNSAIKPSNMLKWARKTKDGRSPAKP